MPITGIWVLVGSLCYVASAPEVFSIASKGSIQASSQKFDGRHKVTTATSFQNTVFKRSPVAHRSPNDARMRLHRQAKSDADITVKGKLAGSRLTRIIDTCMEKGQKLVRMETISKDVADHRTISFCDNQKKPSVANVSAGRKVLECAVTDLAKDVREIVDLLPELTKTAINFPEKSLKGVLCDPNLIQLNLAAITAKMVQRICEECEIGQQNVPQQIIHALGGVDSLGNPLRTEVEKAAEIVEKVSEIITYDDFKNRYLDLKKYKRVVKWAGYGSDYVDKEALKKAIKRRIKESFLNETLHIAHVVPDGVGVVVDAIGELQKELKTTIDVGGVTSWFSTKLLIQNWSTVRQRFAIFVRSALGLGDRTLVLDAKSRITYPADIIIAAAAKGIEAHFVAYEGGDHTKMDIARLLDKIVANEKNPDISMKNVNLEFHVGWEKKSTDASRDAATKLCEFASAYWKPRLKVYSYASEVKDGKVEPTSQCPKPKTDIEPPYSVGMQ